MTPIRAVRGMDGAATVVEVDEPPGSGELLRMRSVSICGSDFGYLAMGSPFVLGHELAGVREDGTAVVVEAAMGCGACDWCTSGRTNLCHLVTQAGLGMGADGGMCELFRAPARHVVELPPELAVQDASLVEPASVSWHGARIGGAGPGRRVAVVGGGAVGLFTVAVARAMAADEVGLDARYAHQREIGERFGALEIDGLYDVVIEAAGSASSLARSVELVAPGGTVVVLGVHWGAVQIDMTSLLIKEARLQPSLGYCRHEGGRDMADAAAMLASSPDIVDALVTHRFPLEDAAEAFRVAQDRKGGAIKVVLEP